MVPLFAAGTITEAEVAALELQFICEQLSLQDDVKNADI